ncbi:SPFH domain-containing protein [Caldimonas sp. KR1-144]|uniref:SPFH domain-containing protein n=1 Tax=Caldimonas sp. KR1-144 TaxID=3400911 RepID=UPI003C0A469B
MLGFRYIKTPPTTYLMQFRGGKLVREGAGLSLFVFSPTSTLVAVPVASRRDDFIEPYMTADFQALTVQGQLTWRISEPRKTAAMLDFSLAAGGKGHVSEDPEKLPQRVLSLLRVLIQQGMKRRALRQALQAGDELGAEALRALAVHPEIAALGLEVLGLAIEAVRPTPETARALEAEAREAILKSADEAIFLRRNAAVENERQIRESELETEIAVERKKRTIRETEVETEASIQDKKARLAQADMRSSIALEDERKQLVASQAENTRALAEAEAHRVGALMQALEKADPKVIQAFASVGMEPGQLIAQAFGGLAERADKIGELNISPDLLRSLMGTGSARAAARAA